ncbi:MAG: hypothetical protein ABI778_06960 [Ignavibacteriota bacterium]
MQFLIETDVLKEYLIAPNGEQTLLRKALATGVCYTTMLNALELFRSCKTKAETDAVLQMLMVVRVLGFNARYGQTFAELANEIETGSSITLNHRESMIVGMAKASKLTIVTNEYYQRYITANAAQVVRSVEEVPIV